ncbi:MAG: hypothetical protein H0U86_15065 [Chloroflexi bacterium]|nr:hypothetical protein [Chloroflexota bacterium]
MPAEPNHDAVKQHGSRAAALAPAAVRILNKYHKTVAKIRRLDVPDATRSKLRDLARADANAALEPLRQDWKTTKASVADITRRRMQPKALDTAGEMRITRAWGRLERLLDGAPESERMALAEQHLQRAKATGDETTLRALWEGLPTFFEASERDDRSREAASRLRDILVEIAGPEEAQRANAEAKEFARGASRIDTTLAQADYALTGDAELEASTAPSQFPGWSESELFTLQPETADEVREDTETSLRALLR